jgi:uncharacterized Zn-binding protein involved in type VI secretion
MFRDDVDWWLVAARVTDMAVCVCPPDAIAMGSTTVLIGSLPAARLGDPTIHGGLSACPIGAHRYHSLLSVE